jgi:glycosyltransferase involved in cell wall biosynthesis
MDSVLTQRSDLEKNGVDLEYIVVDPGSTDGSRELIESYGNQVIKVFEKDDGPADGLNKGFSVATGDVYGYLNSDDVLTVGALEYVADYFGSKSEVTDILSGASNLIGPDDEYYRVLYSDRFNLMAFAYMECILIQPSSFFTKSIFMKTNGFNVSNRTNWDGELFVDMAIAGGTFNVVSRVLSGYRVHDESITGSMSTVNDMDLYRVRMFEKITGRSVSTRSDLIAFYYKYARKVWNYKDTIQRILGGRSFGRALK